MRGFCIQMSAISALEMFADIANADINIGTSLKISEPWKPDVTVLKFGKSHGICKSAHEYCIVLHFRTSHYSQYIIPCLQV